MAVVNKFNVNKEQVTLGADIIENMSANDVSYNASTQYDENTVGEKLSELEQKCEILDTIDDEPTTGSDNLVKSGGVATIQKGDLKKKSGITTIDLDIADFILLNHRLTTISNGYITAALDYRIYYLQIDADCLIKYKLGASSIAGNAALFICDSQPSTGIAFTNPIERVAYLEGSFTIMKGQYLCIQGYSTYDSYLPSLLKKEVTLFENINIFDELGEKESDSSIESTNVWSAIEEVNSNIPQINTIASSIKPLMVDTASFFYTHKQATNFNQDNPFKISGIANSNTLNVLSGGQDTSVLTSADNLASIVIKFDDGTCKPYILTGWSANTLTIYPSIDTAITDGEVVPLMLDTQHLTKYGYNAYSQHLFFENPRYCEKNKFIERYGNTDAPPFSSLSGAPSRYEASRNDGGAYSCQYGNTGIFMIPFADYSTISEYGYQWEVSTNGVKGYLETYIGTCYGFYPTNTFTLDTGYEIHIECWIDDVKTYEKIKDNIFIERICIPYAKSDDKVKLKVYLTQLRKQKDTLYIGPTTFWVNEIERNNLIDKHEVVAQLFDSWGIFSADNNYIEDKDGNKWYQGQSGKELHRLINENNGLILPYYNYSEGGMTTRWGKVWWYHNVWTFHPDIMITDFGINDYHTNMAQFPDFTDPYGNTISMGTAVTSTEFSQNMETLFDMCIRHNIVPIYVMCSRIGCDINYINAFVDNHAQQLSLT